MEEGKKNLLALREGTLSEHLEVLGLVVELKIRLHVSVVDHVQTGHHAHNSTIGQVESERAGSDRGHSPLEVLERELLSGESLSVVSVGDKVVSKSVEGLFHLLQTGLGQG